MQIIKRILKLALPVVAEMMLYMLIWITDTAFMGRYGGNDYVTAVGFSGSMLFTLCSILVYMGISVGVNAMVAQSAGAKKFLKAENFLNQGLALVLIVSCLILLLFQLWAEEILQLAGLHDHVLTYGVVYVKIVSFGLFFNMLTNVLSAGLRGVGNTVVPLKAAVLLNIVHIFFSWVLIFGNLGFPALGIVGIGAATCLAHISGFVYMAAYYCLHAPIKIRLKALRRLKYLYLRKIILISVPSGLQEAAFSISRILTMMLVIHLGVTAFAANEVTISIESVSFMPGWGFSVAAITLVGQSIGAKRWREAKNNAVFCTGFGIIIMSLCMIIFLTVPELLVALFIKDQETIALAAVCLRIAAVEQPFLALGMGFEGAFRGTGDTKTPFLLALSSNWLIRIPLIYAVIYVWRLDIYYVWAVMALQWIYEGLLMAYLFYRKTRKWPQDK